MALQVTLTKAPDDIAGSLGLTTVQTFDEQGGTLGRSSSNSWPLPDPDRFLSSCHCEIVYEGSQFYIVDLSTNGTFVNGSPEPLGKGMRRALADGDSFEIGDYQFSIALDSARDGHLDSPFQPTAPEINPFGAAPPDTAFGDIPAPFSHSPSTDDFLPLSAVPENNDPLAALDQAQGSYPGTERDNDPFSTSQNSWPRDPYGGMGTVDPTPSMDQAVAWPESAQQNLIPDDWEDDLLGGDSTTSSSFAAPEIQLAPTTAPRAIPEPVAIPSGRPEPFSSPETELSEPSEVQDVVLPTPARPLRKEEGESEVLVERKAMPRQEVPVPEQQDLVDHSFVAALGLDHGQLSDEQCSAINRMGGELLREIIEGMMQLLRSRTSIKNEFRMNVTTIEPFENNPLKFSVGIDDALENIFLKKGKAYKEPLEAFREGFLEVGEHQLAMIAGIRTGFEKMMDRFNPELLEELFSRRGKHSALPGLRQSRCWTNYCDYYAGFSDNMESSFQSLFGSDFVQAYEDHLRILSASRKQQSKGELG